MYRVRQEFKKIAQKEWHYHTFECEWYKCRMIRDRWRSRCWYVWIPKSHPAFGKDYYNDAQTDIETAINEINIHWWLTFASDWLYMQPEKDLRWFGFDTAHCRDINIWEYESINIPTIDSDMSDYRDKEYVIKNVKDLAKQLKEIE